MVPPWGRPLRKVFGPSCDCQHRWFLTDAAAAEQPRRGISARTAWLRSGSDMSSQRLAPALGLALLAVMLVSGYWLWGRLRDLEPAPIFVPTALQTAVPTVPPLPTLARLPPGYRLAGVAVGEPESFAVVEAPSGTHGLYRRGEEVPGLGRVLRIEPERIVVQNDAGQFELWLTPAPTVTAGRVPPVAATMVPPTPAASVPTSRPPAERGAGTTPESSP